MRPDGEALRRRRRAERLTGALSLSLTLLGLGGVATAGGPFLVGTTVTAGWTGASAVDAESIVVLTQGHSHNDYVQRRPLADALELGYTSVEVDIWKVGSRLLVGHELLEATRADRTLQDLYLDPLRTWVEANSGSVFPGAGFTLLVDVKSSATTTYAELDKVLRGYSSMLTKFTRSGRVTPGAVTVVVTGNRATSAMAAQTERWAAYDGRYSDLSSWTPKPLSLMPLVSENWSNWFRWRGVGTMPSAERARLATMVAKAHSQGRKIRFYGTPAATAAVREAVWRAELDAGVDLLNVDNLLAGQRFLLGYGAGPAS